MAAVTRAWEAHEQEADRLQAAKYIHLGGGPDRTREPEERGRRSRLWHALNVSTSDAVSAKRRSVDFQSHFQALAQKAALAFFCYGCGKPIFIHCECEGFQDILVQPWDLPPAVPSSGTPADKMWWHAALMSLTVYASVGGSSLGAFYTDYLPMIVVALQRNQHELQSAAERYARDADVKQVGIEMKEDLGTTCIFPDMLEAINLHTDQEARQYILSAMTKLLAFDFAKLSLFELWLCDAIWKSASIPAPAIEVLQLFRKHLFSVLSAVFTMEHLCPDHRCIDIIANTKNE